MGNRGSPFLKESTLPILALPQQLLTPLPRVIWHFFLPQTTLASIMTLVVVVVVVVVVAIVVVGLVAGTG